MTWTHTGYAQRIHFGPGMVERVGDVCRALGMHRVLVVTTDGRRSSPDGARLLDALGSSIDAVAVFAGVRSHVPAAAVDAAVDQAAGVDGVVSFGGGSCADLAKAVCHAAEGPGDVREEPATYADRPALPHVSVPTTYSGAELTPFYGTTGPDGRKRGAGGPTLAPLAAVYDPVVTLGTPARVSAETGMNALAHGVECAYSPTRSPEAEAVALACVERVAAALPLVVDRPGDLEARTAMLAGAVLGGRCLQNAGMGVHHGLSQLLGGRTGLPHGLMNAVVLPHAMAFNAGAAGPAAARIGAALGDPADPAGALARLRDRLGLPATLAECGVTEEDLDAVAAAAPSNANVARNLRPVTVDDARAILAAAFGR
ncbi:MAG TPA: iron-containing alcohol dehydrogenase [Acidimicrobiales bacterium]|nr:iron-containing alcohol dehydrogenase [Acidimicrobiales bacterium]